MRQTSKSLQVKAVLLASVGVLSALPAQGQDLALEEIVVTARQRSELLSDIPIAVSAFGAEAIERLNINTIEDLSKYNPGLTFTRGNQPNGTKLSMRGMDVQRGRSPVAIRVDGIDLTTESVYSTGIGYLGNQRLMDLERIEVVKGAQVALYGRAAFAGAINYVTKRPNFEKLEALFNADINSEDEQELTASFNGPAIADRLALGFNATYWNDGGSHTNQLSGKKLGFGEGTGIAGSFLFTPSEPLSIYGRAEYTQDKIGMEPGIIVSPETVVTFTDPEVIDAVNGASGLIFVGTVPHVDPSDLAISLAPRNLDDYPGMDKESIVASLIIDYEFDGFTVTSLTGWLDQETENYQSNIYQPTPFVDNGVPNPNGGIVPAFNTAQEFDNLTTSRIFNQELRIQSNDENRLRWQVGALYWEEELDQAQDQTTLFPLTPIASDVFLEFFRENTGDRQRNFGRDTYHWSFYAWLEYDITDQLSVSAEIRHNDEDNDYLARDTVNVTIGLPPPLDSSSDDPLLLRVSRTDLTPALQPIAQISQSFTTPKFSIRYQPNDDTTLYASATKSIKPAGHATGGTEIFSNLTLFETEKLWSYEAGAKGRFLDGQATANAAFFYQDYTNQQVGTVVFDEESELPRGATENAGQSRRWGIELDGVVRMTDEFTLSGAYTYLDTKFTEFEIFTSSVLTAAEAPGGCIRIDAFPNGQAACVLDYSGNRAAQVPKHSFNVTGNYTAELSANYDWFAEANVRFTDDRFLSFANNAIAPSVWRVDLRAGVQSEDLVAMLYVNNLLDSDRATEISRFLDYNTSTFSPAPLVFLPDPITVGIRLGYSL